MPTAKRVKLDPPGAPLVGKSKAFPVSGSMLKTVIGPDDDKREFHIHEALLTAHSKFFANAMRRGWKEAEEKIVKLSDDEHKVFELYVSLIYIGTVRAFDEQRRRIVPEDPGQASLTILKSARANIQARNATVDALITKVQHESQVVNTEGRGPCMPSVPSIQRMYEETSYHCPGRQVLIDCFVWYGQAHTTNEIVRKVGTGVILPQQFLMDLSDNLMCRRQHPRDGMLEKESYHEDDMNVEGWIMYDWWDIECYRMPSSKTKPYVGSIGAQTRKQIPSDGNYNWDFWQ